MAIAPGVRLGPYEVVALIGEGGMGKVWRAHHTALRRDDALKVLPDTFAADPDRLARFRREAQVLASLNHANIAHVYGLEQSDGVQALVMELVDGPTLADRIAQGRIPVDEALPIASQIAEALEAAHEQGIIHRDLKPANIKIRPDGTVKVLDFGLAKALEPTSPRSMDATASPTITSPALMTGVGVLLGTAAYMSPEQARGKAVNKRSDIWAFGCVLYEMLTGRRAFDGEDIVDTLGAVTRLDPDWGALPPDTPDPILRLLRRALQKDPRERLPEIGTARLEIKDAAAEPAETVALATAKRTSASVSSRRERFGWAAAILLAAAASALGVTYWLQSASISAPEMRVEISTPRTNTPSSLALSPDGRHLAFVAIGEDGQSRLLLRSLDVVGTRDLAGTEGAFYPFWSPDSRSVAFFAGNQLKRIEISGGSPLTIADAPVGRGGTWNSDGVILFASFDAKGNGLLQVSASGGAAVMARETRSGRTDRFPQFLPDGDHFLFFSRNLTGTETNADGALYLGSLSSGENWRLTSAEAGGPHVRGGWVLFVREGMLLAQRLDLSRRVLTGEPLSIASDVYYDGTITNVSAVSASASGVVAYRTGNRALRQLAWFDRTGKDAGTVGAVDSGNLSAVELSPDGRRAATARIVLGNMDVWLLDSDRTTRFTFDGRDDTFPVWTPDGRRIVFDSDRSGGIRHLYWKPSSGGGSDELLTDVPTANKAANDVSPDGRVLLFSADNPKNAWDIWALPLEGKRKPFAFINTSYDERSSQFSSDGRWVSYHSNESGRYEVYVRPFPGPGGQWQISTDGGVQSRWAPNGKELYYLAPDGTLMAVPIVVSATAIEPGTPVALFRTRIWNGGATQRIQYDVAPDGRFLINVAVDQGAASPITLLLNWTPELTN